MNDASKKTHLRDADDEARGAAIREQREVADMTLVQLAEETGLSRQTIARAEGGHASKSTFRTLESFFETEISGPPEGAAAASTGLIEFEVEGDGGYRVVVRGPIANAEDLERSVARIVETIRQRPKSSPESSD